MSSSWATQTEDHTVLHDLCTKCIHEFQNFLLAITTQEAGLQSMSNLQYDRFENWANRVRANLLVEDPALLDDGARDNDVTENKNLLVWYQSLSNHGPRKISKWGFLDYRLRDDNEMKSSVRKCLVELLRYLGKGWPHLEEASALIRMFSRFI